MSRLRLGFASQQLGDQVHQGRIHIIERYLDSLTTYAGSVVDLIDDDGDASLRSASPPPGNETTMARPSQRSSPTPTIRAEFDTDGVPQNLDHQPELDDSTSVGPTQTGVPWSEDGRDTITKGDGDGPIALRPVSSSATSQSTLPITSQVSEDLPPEQPLNPGTLFDDTAITVLIIGPPGHGKSSFIRCLMHLPGRPTGDFAHQTKDPVVIGPATVYEAEVSTSGYHLIHKVTDKIVPLSTSEGRLSVLTHDTFKIGLINPNAPYVKLRLIEGDFNYSLSGMEMVESMSNLLATLRILPFYLNESWNGAVDAVALVHKAGPEISVSCQRTFRYFESTMPELFSRPSAVNTHANPRLADATRKRVREARVKELGSLVKTLDKEQNHIFIDSLPSAGLLYTEFSTCLEIHSLLSLWSSQKTSLPPPPTRTPETRLVKTSEMQQIDSLMVEALKKAVVRWKAQIQNLKERCAKQEEEIANAEVDLKDSIMQLSKSEADIAKYDTEEKVWLRGYSTGQSMSLVRTTRRIFSGKRQIRITEPYDDFRVEWETRDGGVSGRWLNDAEYDRAARTWKHGYKIYVQGAQLFARSYVLKRVKHREDILNLGTQIDTLRRDILVLRQKVETTTNKLDSYRKEEDLLEVYEERIEAVSSWENELARKELPANKTFNKEERKRYAMLATDLVVLDLLAFIKTLGRSSLVGAVGRVLGSPVGLPLHTVLADRASGAAISEMPLTAGGLFPPAEEVSPAEAEEVSPAVEE